MKMKMVTGTLTKSAIPHPTPAPNCAVKMKARPRMLKITRCPDTMLPNRRKASANGFVNRPSTSTGMRINLTAVGTPGGQKKCFQYAFVPENGVKKKVTIDSDAVTIMLDVEVKPNGNRPNRDPMRINRQNVVQ